MKNNEHKFEKFQEDQDHEKKGKGKKRSKSKDRKKGKGRGKNKKNDNGWSDPKKQSEFDKEAYKNFGKLDAVNIKMLN